MHVFQLVARVLVCTAVINIIYIHINLVHYNIILTRLRARNGPRTRVCSKVAVPRPAAPSLNPSQRYKYVVAVVAAIVHVNTAYGIYVLLKFIITRIHSDKNN